MSNEAVCILIGCFLIAWAIERSAEAANRARHRQAEALEKSSQSLEQISRALHAIVLRLPD